MTRKNNEYQQLILLRMSVEAIHDRVTRELRALEDRISRLIPPEESSGRRVTRQDLEAAAKNKGGRQ